MTSGPSKLTSVLSETLPIMLETITMVKTLHITLQAKSTWIINENIREPAEANGVDIPTPGNTVGPPQNISHDVRDNYDS
jgi:hypothetical protein